MRLVTWTVFLCFRPGWSFQMITPSLRGPMRRATAVDGSSNRSSSKCTLQSTATFKRPETNDDIKAVSPSSLGLGLKGVVAGFLATALVLASEPAATLADAGSLPAAMSSSSSAAASLQSAAEESPAVVVATTKLQGELAAQFQKAQAAGSVQQFDKAKKLYNQVIKYAPGYVYGWSNRANVLIADGDLKGAMADYNRALELADGLNMPDKWVIFLNRGTTLLALGEDDLALSDLNQAAKLNNQKDLYTLANRAQAFERRGDWSKALVDYEGAIGVQPGNVQPWWIRYSLVLFQEGRDFDSLACLRRIQSKFEGVAEVQAALTAVQFGRGEVKEAEKAWRGINVVDQQTYLKESYLKDQLKWPPRMVDNLEGFDRQQKQESAGAA